MQQSIVAVNLTDDLAIKHHRRNAAIKLAGVTPTCRPIHPIRYAGHRVRPSNQTFYRRYNYRLERPPPSPPKTPKTQAITSEWQPPVRPLCPTSQQRALAILNLSRYRANKSAFPKRSRLADKAGKHWLYGRRVYAVES